MKHRLRYRLALAFFVIYLVGVIWPVAKWVAEPMPLIMGLPVSLAWAIGWILAGFGVLVVLEWFEERR